MKANTNRKYQHEKVNVWTVKTISYMCKIRIKSEGCGHESSVAEEVSGLVDVTDSSGEETVFVV